MLSEPLAESTVELKHVHDAMALARDVVVLCRVLYRIGHKNRAVDYSDVERGIGIRQVSWIDKLWRRGHRVE